MALVLGLLMSAGLYFAYLWPSVEPNDDEDDEEAEARSEPPKSEDKEPAA